ARGAMLTDFYIAFGTVCFTLLGLWLIVVQTRHAEWRGVAVYRRRAYGVALHFSLPGLMSLLALVNPDSTALWRGGRVVVVAGVVCGRCREWGDRAAAGPRAAARHDRPGGLSGSGGPVRPDRRDRGGSQPGHRRRPVRPGCAGRSRPAHHLGVRRRQPGLAAA